jgi:hypothetical protein
VTESTRTLTFSDNLTPTAGHGTYQIKVSQWLSTVNDQAITLPEVTQMVEVTGIRLQLGDTEVHGVYPPSGASGAFHDMLPHITLERRILPWETHLKWNGTEHKKRPWLALLLFTTDELLDDPQAAGQITRGGAQELLVDAAGLTLPSPFLLAEEEKNQQVRTIRMTKDVFAALAPKPDELAYLAHIRSPLPDPP